MEIRVVGAYIDKRLRTQILARWNRYENRPTSGSKFSIGESRGSFGGWEENTTRLEK